MKVFELEVSGASYPLHVSELGGAKLFNGDRVMVSEHMRKMLTAHDAYLDEVAVHEMPSLEFGAWQRVAKLAPKPAATAKDEVVQPDVEKVARNMSMHDKPGRRHKSKTL